MSEPRSIFLSVVVPCYNEQDVLPELFRRVSAVCAAVDGPFEIVLVNDGSTDATWPAIQALTERHPEVVGVNLSRNHGHQLALSAGLSVCRGERVLIIDADLQDPPELLPQMMQKMDDGTEVVYGKRRTRYGDGLLKRNACKVFYRMLQRLSDTPIPLDTGDFRLISRRVVDLVVAMPERHRFIRGMVSWTGLRQEALEYDRDARHAGDTKYPFRKLMRLALDGVTAFSVKPLALASVAGVFCGLGALILLAYSIVGWIFYDTPAGWTSLMAAMALLGSVQLFVLGIIGEYIGRLYEQSKGRPLFIIESVTRGEDAAAEKSAEARRSNVTRTGESDASCEESASPTTERQTPAASRVKAMSGAGRETTPS